MPGKTITPPQIQTDTSSDYIPMARFHKMMSERQSPYQCKFSLKPFLEKVNAKIADSDLEKNAPIRLLMDKISENLSQFSDENFDGINKGRLEVMLSFMFPSLFFEGQKGFIAVPFSKQFLYLTPGMDNIMHSDDWEMKLPEFVRTQEHSKPNLDIANLILRNFYNVNAKWTPNEVIRMRNTKTGLEKFFKINIVEDFVRGIALKPLKKLGKTELHELLENLHKSEFWVECLPPENFAFEGMVIGFLQDVTNVEALSVSKHMLADKTQYEENHLELLAQLQQMTRSFLEMPEIEIGMVQRSAAPGQEGSSWNLLRFFDREIMGSSLEDQEGGYGTVLRTNEPLIITDLKDKKYLSKCEKRLVEKGTRSLVLAPLHNENGEIIGIFELAAPKPFQFTTLTLIKMKEIIALFAMGTNRFIQDLDNQTQLTVLREFTSIHPSVEWKFRETATKFFWQNHIDGLGTKPEPIVFKNLYPIYGQADIVGSSKTRNQAVSADLTDNLKRLAEVLEESRRKLEFHLLDVYLMKVKNNLERLSEGNFVSSDETQIIELLTREIHPLLRKLKNRYEELPKKLINEYFKVLDPNLDIVYRHRKAYEDSVAELNQTMGKFMESEDKKMQKILPHYFEKYTTDGVEYNIYLGQSILQNEEFHDFYVKDFRLWQLIKMVEVTHLVAKTSKNLPVPLKTAQLIFVYNNTMSIRFDMEEKQFDVDGTYNVRYEILKKRIDKAVIKGTGERLTVHGKIAIVWLQDKDRREYLEYLYHLIERGLISDEIEELELEKLQGAEGLKAFRVSVIPKS